VILISFINFTLQAALKDNAKLVEDDENLKHLWEWLDFAILLTEKEKYRVPSVGSIKYPGARTVLRIDSTPGTTLGPMKSETIHNNSFDLHNNKTYK
jgi:hypothetical protein